MRTLYIDTSSSFLYSAIVEDNKILGEIKEEYGQSLSEVALPRIVSIFNDNNIKPEDIDKIIVVNGPGSFTGIRIGITIAKVYSWSLNIPITTITSLEAMSLSSETTKYHVPAIDARRGYVFSAIYDENNNQVLKPQHIKIEDLKQEMSKLDDYVVITNDEYLDEDFDNIEGYNPNLLKIVNYYKDKEPINPHAINPDYLKLTEAEESKLN
ncbi:MAG: tRNA (adenosine(37)-N6)-threonylcarbamoyltransferase complex dimerization subunit type 1 TsaB [Bacilli bacterium]|nr:tRNA (adenosine(37)-N6)-threonylcarbamoyltransferase complex dimerization subunit type 1 TsaB [Bacilli bacterium]